MILFSGEQAVCLIQEISPPAQKLFPFPLKTIADISD